MSKENVKILSDAIVTRWGTIQQAADYMQCGQKTIRRMISRGEIEAQRFGPRLIRVDLSCLDQVGHRL